MARIRNWDKWQTYRKGRGQPPWIKVHLRLARNAEWVTLTDAERGQLLCMWMLAADNGGNIPDDPAMIQKLCHMTKRPNMEKFAKLQFVNSPMATRVKKYGATETETESSVLRETSAEAEGEGDPPTPPAGGNGTGPDLPSWIPEEAWAAWLDMRKRMKRPATERAQVLAVKTLERLMDEGNDPGEVIEQSIVSGWAGLFQVKRRGGMSADAAVGRAVKEGREWAAQEAERMRHERR